MQGNKFTPFNMKVRPDQYNHELQQMARRQEQNQISNRVLSPDGKEMIVIGVQPDNSFGIAKYKVSGDTLELINKIL